MKVIYFVHGSVYPHDTVLPGGVTAGPSAALRVLGLDFAGDALVSDKLQGEDRRSNVSKVKISFIFRVLPLPDSYVCAGGPTTRPRGDHSPPLGPSGNHTRWYIFYKDRGFHNHRVAHRALALWALNASGAHIKEACASDSAYQRPLCVSPAPITPGNRLLKPTVEDNLIMVGNPNREEG
ncbi:hypothetical protein DXG01_010387 [Tephrocybe rancida]|nr:hypothetical protein DXG01_010387 [Tephrocybe rancida]